MRDGCLVIHHTSHKGMPFDSTNGAAERQLQGNLLGGRSVVAGNSNSNTSGVRATHSCRSDQHNLLDQAADSSDLGKTCSTDKGLSTIREEDHRAKKACAALQRRQEKADEENVSGSTSSPDNPSVPQHELNFSLLQRNKIILLDRLSEASRRGRLTMINLSQRSLAVNDALLIENGVRQNPLLSVLKLGYNDLGDDGACIIARAFVQNDGRHRSLSVLDLGFNGVGDKGCTALALHAVAGNLVLQTLSLSGNQIHEEGAMAIAGALLHGSGLTSLHLTANKIGPVGAKAIASAVAECEARRPVPIFVFGEIFLTKRIEELYIGNTYMESSGFMQISSMVLTNRSLQVLGLSNNGIDDHDMSLLAQALTRNTSLPLQSLHLSFNEITCVGVECLMNAVWGSKTLREIKLDNNKIRDRGVQLCAVVLTSIELAVLDLGFNRVTTVGIRALMKALSENSSLRTLTISGLPLDQNASKAVSYAIAYNSSLRVFHADNCSVSYSAQRHIVAGIVSNRNSSLRNLTGFPLGPITVTLGMPQKLESWSNDQVLGFVRLMWRRWPQNESLNNAARKESGKNRELVGPAPPETVAAAARQALIFLGNDDGEALRSEVHEREVSETSPLVPVDATLLERSPSGTVQSPTFCSEESKIVGAACQSNLPRQVSIHPIHLADPTRKNRNLQWLRKHFRSLNEVGQLPFNHAHLWQLHQYFFSPAYSPTDEGDSTETTVCSGEHPESETDSSDTSHVGVYAIPATRSESPSDTISAPPLGRALSYQTLSDASVPVLHMSVNNKRQPSIDGISATVKHAAKRAKNLQPRIAFYPRIREKVEALGTKPAEQTLAVLLQLKYIESVLFQGRNVYLDENLDEGEQPSTLDAEMILLDLL